MKAWGSDGWVTIASLPGISPHPDPPIMPVLHALDELRRRLARAGASAGRLARRDDGATMAEYALLVAVVALVALVGAKTLGTTLKNGGIYGASKIANP